jgi:hypothetical protein
MKKHVLTSRYISPIFGDIDILDNITNKINLDIVFDAFPELSEGEKQYVVNTVDAVFPGINLQLSKTKYCKETARLTMVSKFKDGHSKKDSKFKECRSGKELKEYANGHSELYEYFDFISTKIIDYIYGTEEAAPAPKKEQEPVQNIPIQNLSDKELLEKYIASETDEIESEINKRVKGRAFIVLLSDGKINLDESLKYLKIARKQDTPRQFKTPVGELIELHRIEEIHSPNRRRIMSPFNRSSSLFEGYCGSCEENIGNLPMNILQLIAIIVEIYGPFDLMGKKNIVELATNSINISESNKNLYNTFPRAVQRYNELSLSGNLPNLILVENVGIAFIGNISTGTIKSDPWYGTTTINTNAFPGLATQTFMSAYGSTTSNITGKAGT